MKRAGQFDLAANGYRRMHVCILGAFDDSVKPDNDELMASQLERSGIKVSRIRAGMPFGTRIQAIRRCDAVYTTYQGHSYRFFALVRALGKRSINHWVGSDVWSAITNPAEARLARLTNLFIDKHLAVAPHLAVQLASIGLQAEVVPIVPSFERAELRPVDASQARVLAYLPNNPPNFYGADIIYGLAERFTQVPFAVLACPPEIQRPLPNIEYLGRVPDINEVYGRSSILIRMTKHDGLPRMVLESLARGYQVIYKHGFPYCHQAGDLEEAASCLARIIADGCPINYEGRRHVLEHYDQQSALRQLITALQS